MNILGVQLILIFFGLFMVYVLFLHWKKKNISNKMFGVWSLIWFGFVFFSIFPTLLSPLLSELFIVRVMDLGMIIAFMILTFVTIENNIKIKKYEEELEKLIRKLAIKNKK
ncbi:MAG TPA: DUF2304 domain-containing protein [Candidatus Woesebacteria bacterium]|nr:DUF2304 domain-containing protein [Candidatus Woesebacteria bacterium]